jgi:hypothetical protein
MFDRGKYGTVLWRERECFREGATAKPASGESAAMPTALTLSLIAAGTRACPRRAQTTSGTISIAPHGHSVAHMPQPLQ